MALATSSARWTTSGSAPPARARRTRSATGPRSGPRRPPSRGRSSRRARRGRSTRPATGRRLLGGPWHVEHHPVVATAPGGHHLTDQRRRRRRHGSRAIRAPRHALDRQCLTQRARPEPAGRVREVPPGDPGSTVETDHATQPRAPRIQVDQHRRTRTTRGQRERRGQHARPHSSRPADDRDRDGRPAPIPSATSLSCSTNQSPPRAARPRCGAEVQPRSGTARPGRGAVAETCTCPRRGGAAAAAGTAWSAPTSRSSAPTQRPSPRPRSDATSTSAPAAAARRSTSPAEEVVSGEEECRASSHAATVSSGPDGPSSRAAGLWTGRAPAAPVDRTRPDVRTKNGAGPWPGGIARGPGSGPGGISPDRYQRGGIAGSSSSGRSPGVRACVR